MSTYTDASLIYYPSGYKAGKAYSLKPTDGSGDLTFTRASTATRVNESGLIEEVAANVPRLDNSQGGCSTLLLEPQRTNSFTFSENINNFSTLGRLNCVYTLGSSFGGFTTSCLVTSTSFTGSLIRGVLGFNSVNTENNYFTIRFQKKSGWYLNVISGNGCASGDLRINLASGGGYISSSGTMLTDYKIVEFSDYFQIGFKTTQIATTSAGLLNLNLYDNASFINYNDAGGTTFNISGIQRENQQTYGTSYIPTSGTAVTRVVDGFSVSSLFSKGIVGVNGSLFIDINTANLSGLTFTMWNTLNQRSGVIRFTSASNTFYIGLLEGSSGSTQVSLGSLPPRAKLLFRKNGTTYTLFYNGVKASTDMTAPVQTWDKMQVESDFAPNMTINSAMLFNSALSDTDAIALTTL